MHTLWLYIHSSVHTFTLLVLARVCVSVHQMYLQLPLPTQERSTVAWSLKFPLWACRKTHRSTLSTALDLHRRDPGESYLKLKTFFNLLHRDKHTFYHYWHKLCKYLLCQCRLWCSFCDRLSSLCVFRCRCASAHACLWGKQVDVQREREVQLLAIWEKLIGQYN